MTFRWKLSLQAVFWVAAYVDDHEAGVRQYVSGKINLWVRCVELLARAARSYPQSAYAAFTHSLSCKWLYFQRVMEGCEEEYCRLRDVIHQVFTPAVLGRKVLNVEHSLFKLPAKLGGLALDDPVKSASSSFFTSKPANSVLQEAVRTGNEIIMADHVAHCQAVVRKAVKQKEEAQQQLSNHLIEDLPAPHRLTLRRIVKGSASGWLAILPLHSVKKAMICQPPMANSMTNLPSAINVS